LSWSTYRYFHFWLWTSTSHQLCFQIVSQIRDISCIYLLSHQIVKRPRALSRFRCTIHKFLLCLQHCCATLQKSLWIHLCFPVFSVGLAIHVTICIVIIRIHTNFRLIQTPLDWYKHRSIDTNTSRLIQTPFDWNTFDCWVGDFYRTKNELSFFVTDFCRPYGLLDLLEKFKQIIKDEIIDKKKLQKKVLCWLSGYTCCVDWLFSFAVLLGCMHGWLVGCVGCIIGCIGWLYWLEILVGWLY